MEGDDLRLEIKKLKSALEFKDDFIIWLIEVHHEFNEHYDELYARFAEYENNQQ